jgi:hypothetical protein
LVEEENCSLWPEMESELEVESLASNGRATLEPRKWILVTGGAGYIGSHTVLQLLTEGYCVVIIDNLDNSCEEAVNRVRKLAGEFGANLKFYKVFSILSRLLELFLEGLSAVAFWFSGGGEVCRKGFLGLCWLVVVFLLCCVRPLMRGTQ